MKPCDPNRRQKILWRNTIHLIIIIIIIIIILIIIIITKMYYDKEKILSSTMKYSKNN